MRRARYCGPVPQENLPTAAVLGPGGVGAFLAAALARAGAPVTVVAREATAAAIARDGIAVQSVRLGDFTARPEAVPALREPVGVLFVATKAGGLDAALERLHAEPALVVPLLNGLDHLAVLRRRFGGRAVAATIRVESHRTGPHEVRQSSPFLRVELAADDPTLRPRLEQVAALLEAADVPVHVGESEAQVMWGKLARLNALACTTSAYDLPLGAIRTDPERRAVLEGAIGETVAVAVAEGASLDAGTALAELDEAHAELGSSMQRDIAAGIEPELDAIPGSVLRAADRHGLRCPVIEGLVARIAERAGVPPPRRPASGP